MGGGQLIKHLLYKEGPGFDLYTHIKSRVRVHTYNQHWGGGARRIPRAHWPAIATEKPCLRAQSGQFLRKFPTPPPHDLFHFIAVWCMNHTVVHTYISRFLRALGRMPGFFLQNLRVHGFSG